MSEGVVENAIISLFAWKSPSSSMTNLPTTIVEVYLSTVRVREMNVFCSSTRKVTTLPLKSESSE